MPLCQRDGCKNKIPAGKRRYCSSECLKIVNRMKANETSKERSRNYHYKKPYEIITSKRVSKKEYNLHDRGRDRYGEYIIRRCNGIGCDNLFKSRGSGNRTCSHCLEKREESNPGKLSEGFSISEKDILEADGVNTSYVSRYFLLLRD